MRPLLSASIVLLTGAAMAAPALAQPMTDPASPPVASQPVPDTAQASPGIPGPDAVNPAPGAHGPYVGAGKQSFYDIDQRIAAVSQQVGSLPAGQRRQAAAQLRQIKSEEATQRARHGELRDWDRENISAKLDKLVQQFPALSAAAGDQGPPPPSDRASAAASWRRGGPDLHPMATQANGAA